MGGRSTSGRRSARALLVSLIAHALLVVAVLRVSPPKLAPPPQTVEFELQEPPAPPPAPTPVVVGPPAPKQPAKPLPRTRPTTAPATTPGEPEPEPEPAAATSGPQLPPSPPNLTVDRATVERFTRDGVISAPPAPPAPAVKGPSKWQQKLAMVERDQVGRKNVADGKVHPQVYDFMRDAEKVFTPRESVVEKDERAPNTVGRTARSWSRGFFRNYLDQLRRLEQEEPAHRSALAEGGSDVLAEYSRLLRAAERGAESITCQVCLVIRPGLPPEVVLVKSSANKEVDEAATDALMRAALRRPYDKDLRPERACYTFAASLYRIPPLPIVGCNFDESSMKLGCYYPGKQIYQLKVRLDLVDYSGG